MSEKAKGKQRAVELVEDKPSQEEAKPAEPIRRSLTIRFTDGKPDLGVTVEVGDDVRNIKRKVRSSGTYFSILSQC